MTLLTKWPGSADYVCDIVNNFTRRDSLCDSGTNSGTRGIGLPSCRHQLPAAIEEARPVSRILRDDSLSITLAALFLIAWALQTWCGWVEFAAEQQQHGESAQWLGSSGYLWKWVAATMEKWQSEFLQLLTFVVLTSFLIHKGSHESKDGDEEMRAQLERIERKLDSVQQSSASRSPELTAVSGGLQPAGRV